MPADTPDEALPYAGRERELRLRPATNRITNLSFRFLIPEEDPPFPGVWALDVHPFVLLHPAIQQPDGQRLYELVTRHIRRDPGCLVYLSDVTDELDLNGHTWHTVGISMQPVIDVIALLAAEGHIPARLMWCDPSRDPHQTRHLTLPAH